MLRLLPVLCLTWLLSGASGMAASQFGSAEADKTETHKKDPVESAFALPHGVKLRKDQQTDYDKLKKNYAPKLKEKIQLAHSGDSENDKVANAKEAIKLKGEVKAEIQKILNKPDPAAKKMQPKKPKQQAKKARKRK